MEVYKPALHENFSPKYSEYFEAKGLKGIHERHLDDIWPVYGHL